MRETLKIIMNGISKGGVMPHAKEMLDYLKAKGIRMGVISNFCFSENALRDLFDRLLPGNRFEFVLVSSEYLFRKPHSLMFEVALQKAGLSADKVWYCGDSIEADVYGAKNVGIFPVLYEGTTPDHVDPFAHQNDGKKMEFEHLHIHDWRELVEGLG
jgi:putative hydrolase of the HAD superfamily